MKKHIFLIVSSISLIVILTLVFILTYEKEEQDPIIKQLITEYFTPIEVNHNIDLDSLLNSYFLVIDTINPLYKIIIEYDSVSQKLKSKKFFNHKNELFASECFWYWKYEHFSDVIEDTTICKEFDHYRDWYKNEFPNGGVVLDVFLNPNGTREIAYYHGSGCSCCSEVNIKFKTVRFYKQDDPRKILEDYHLTNQVLSREDSEHLRKQIGAISFNIKMDSINNLNLSVTKLNNYSFNNEEIDVVILKKETEFFY